MSTKQPVDINRSDGGAACDVQVDAGTYDHCDSPKLNKYEWGWDAQMELEMRRDGMKKNIEPFGRNCEYRYLLHIDGNVASSRLASEMHVGSTIFKQESFSNEHFYPLLRPWTHQQTPRQNHRCLCPHCQPTHQSSRSSPLRQHHSV